MAWGLANEPPVSVRLLLRRYQSGSIAPSVIQGGMTNKLVEEFRFLRVQASEPLGQFLDYITCVVRAFTSYILECC